MSKLIDLTGLSEFLKKCKEIFAEKGSGGSTLQITGTYNGNDSEFTCTSGHSLDDVKNALLAGILVVVDVVVNNNERYITNDISVFHDEYGWYAYSKTFCNGMIDNWVVQS